MAPPWYGTTAWSFPLMGAWHSWCEVEIPPQGRGGPLVASGDFRRTFGNWPTVQLFGFDPSWEGDSGMRSVTQEVLDHPNFTFPFQTRGWLKQDGWMVWIRWRFYKGAVMPQNEVKVPKGNKPEEAFLGPDRFIDDYVHTLIFPSGAASFEYTITIPPDVDHMACDMEYDSGSKIENDHGFGSFILAHTMSPDPPPWPYKTTSLASPPAGVRNYRSSASAVRRARGDLTQARGERRVTGQYIGAALDLRGTRPDEVIV